MIAILQALLTALTTGIAFSDPTPFKVGCAVCCALMFVFCLALEVRS